MIKDEYFKIFGYSTVRILKRC